MSRDMRRQRAKLVIDCAIRDLEHAREIIADLAKVDGAVAQCDAELYKALNDACLSG